MDLEQALATTHILAALTALGAGATVLLFPKGTHRHRMIGKVYVLALVLVNVAALSLHREAVFGVFHALAVASLITIAVGLTPLLLGQEITVGYRYPRVLHDVVVRRFGGGGCGQFAVAVGQDLAAWVVPVVIATVLTISGVAIFGRVASILDRMLAER